MIRFKENVKSKLSIHKPIHSSCFSSYLVHIIVILILFMIVWLIYYLRANKQQRHFARNSITSMNMLTYGHADMLTCGYIGSGRSINCPNCPINIFPINSSLFLYSVTLSTGGGWKPRILNLTSIENVYLMLSKT